MPITREEELNERAKNPVQIDLFVKQINDNISVLLSFFNDCLSFEGV